VESRGQVLRPSCRSSSPHDFPHEVKVCCVSCTACARRRLTSPTCCSYESVVHECYRPSRHPALPTLPQLAQSFNSVFGYRCLAQRLAASAIGCLAWNKDIGVVDQRFDAFIGSLTQRMLAGEAVRANGASSVFAAISQALRRFSGAISLNSLLTLREDLVGMCKSRIKVISHATPCSPSPRRRRVALGGAFRHLEHYSVAKEYVSSLGVHVMLRECEAAGSAERPKLSMWPVAAPDCSGPSTSSWTSAFALRAVPFRTQRVATVEVGA